MTTRNPLYDALCGDVWQLDDGRTFVVDYKDSLTTGITFLDGSREGHGYTQYFGDWVKGQKGKLISSFEQRPLPWNCDEQGRSTNCKEKVPTGDQSISFLKLVLAVSQSQKRRRAD